MATISGIRGLLLEEALLYLLKASGYKTVEDASSDPETLRNGPGGICVNGRGGKHQIDAIADFLISPPFSYPQRLLMEAKCFCDSYKVDLKIIRNSVGVLKDVSEFWVPGNNDVPSRQRYHYQFAVFSASGFTSDAERYAYAQDIYLLNLKNCKYFKPVLDAIRNIRFQDFGASAWNDIDVDLKEFRKDIRMQLNNADEINEDTAHSKAPDNNGFYIEACRTIGASYLAMLNKRFPVFLVPDPDLDLEYFENNSNDFYVRIYWDNNSWYIANGNDQKLFSFNLPLELFDLYQSGGLLSQGEALNLKEDSMSQIQLFITDNNSNILPNSIKIVNLNLDPRWLNSIRERLQEENRES
jgi:hypothetical protein